MAALALLAGLLLSETASAARFGDPGGPPIVFSAGFTSDMVLETSRPTVYGLIQGTLVSKAKVEVTVTGVTASGAALSAYTVQATLATDSEAPPGSGTCQASCMAAGYCCAGLTASCNNPSCYMGCVIAERVDGVEACEAQCKNASGKCSYRVGSGDNVVDLNMCDNCPKLENGTQCNSCDGGKQCLLGCQAAYSGGPPGSWKASLKPAPAGGSITVSVACTAGCGAADPIVLERVTFGQVWICSGQSNMDLSSLFTFSNPAELAKAQAGAYDNVHLFMYGDMGTKYEEVAPAWVTTSGTINSASDAGGTWGNMTHAVSNASNAPDSLFRSFSATCLYFALKLTEEMGPSAPPIGLIQTAIGGSQIEAWMSTEALGHCKNESLNVDGQAPPSRLFNGMIAPFANMSVTGFIWYQGENNCGGTMGNSMSGVGYGCEIVSMVNDWRIKFNNQNAAFGTVTLAAGGSEGNGENMAGMRWSQTANFGTLPAPNLPRSFVAQAFDLGDPMDNLRPPCYNHTSWNTSVCTWPPLTAWNDAVRPLAQAVWDNVAPSFMGGIHPRFKLEVGRRLAVAAHNLLFGGTGAHTGPTIAGCKVTDGSAVIQFNTTLLAGDTVLVQPFNTNKSSWAMPDSNGMAVCVGNASQAQDCLTDVKLWVPASVSPAQNDGSQVAVNVPLPPSGGMTVLAIKYAWPVGKDGDTCCPSREVAEGHTPCIPGSCPLISKQGSLPANPFFAWVNNGKCECIAPQVCDAL